MEFYVSFVVGYWCLSHNRLLNVRSYPAYNFELEYKQNTRRDCEILYRSVFGSGSPLMHETGVKTTNLNRQTKGAREVFNFYQSFFSMNFHFDPQHGNQ